MSVLGTRNGGSYCLCLSSFLSPQISHYQKCGILCGAPLCNCAYALFLKVTSGVEYISVKMEIDWETCGEQRKHLWGQGATENQK